MEGHEDCQKERMDYRRKHQNPARDMKRFMEQEEEDEAEYKVDYFYFIFEHFSAANDQEEDLFWKPCCVIFAAYGGYFSRI